MRVCVRRKAALRGVYIFNCFALFEISIIEYVSFFCGRSLACRWSAMACVCECVWVWQWSPSSADSQFFLHQFRTDQCSIECVTERAKKGKKENRYPSNQYNDNCIATEYDLLAWIWCSWCRLLLLMSCVAIRASPFWRLIQHFRFTYYVEPETIQQWPSSHQLAGRNVGEILKVAGNRKWKASNGESGAHWEWNRDIQFRAVFPVVRDSRNCQIE